MAGSEAVTALESPAFVLSGEGISVRYGGIAALNDVSVAVPANSIVGLIGPNGAGKSTLLSVLSGLAAPQSGSVFLDGIDVTTQGAYQRARKGLSRTFQHPELFPGLTVKEHLTIAWRVRFDNRRMWTDLISTRSWRIPKSSERERIEYLLDRLSLSHIGDMTVSGLPLGLSRLVEVARALVAFPSVVLLDEPFSGLDTAGLTAVSTTLQDLVTTENVSLLLVDHDVEMVLAGSHKIIVLDSGRVIASGSAADVRANEAVRDAYFGGGADIGTRSRG
jgi:branched-chain amino acid transport system ATP-binding protein